MRTLFYSITGKLFHRNIIFYKMNGYFRKFIFKNLSIKNINRLRKLKWFLLNPFINDQKQIFDFYHKEIEIKVLENLILQMPSFPNIHYWIDIGANIGGYSYYLSKYNNKNKGICIGFEPREDIYRRLLKNVKFSNFKPEKIAISNKDGVSEFYLPTSHGLSSMIKMPDFEGFNTTKVNTITLDNYLETNKLTNIMFIKIDVEGYEFEVVEGAYSAIIRENPIILCESEDKHLKLQEKSTDEFINFMKSLGYKAFVISKALSQFIALEQIFTQENIEYQQEYFYNYWFLPEAKLKNLQPLMEQILKDLKL